MGEIRSAHVGPVATAVTLLSLVVFTTTVCFNDNLAGVKSLEECKHTSFKIRWAGQQFCLLKYGV